MEPIITATAIVNTLAFVFGKLVESPAAQKAAEAAISGISGEGAKALFAKFQPWLSKNDKDGEGKLRALRGKAEDLNETQESIEKSIKRTIPHVEAALKDKAFSKEVEESFPRIKDALKDEDFLKKVKELVEKDKISISQSGSGTQVNVQGNYNKTAGSDFIDTGGGDYVGKDKKTYNIGGIDKADFS